MKLGIEEQVLQDVLGHAVLNLKRQILSENLKGAQDKPKSCLSLIFYNECNY